MKFGKRLLTCLALLIIAVVSLGVFAACTEEPTTTPDDQSTPQSTTTSSTTNVTWAGEYYYDAESGAEWTVSIKNDGTFTLNMGEGAVSGKYTYDGNTLAFDKSAYTASYDASGKAVTVTYNSHTYRFAEKIEYTVQFDTNGGSAVAAAKVINGRTLAKPADPTYEGKAFIGWYKDAGFKASFGFGTEPVTGNMTLYARFENKDEAATEYTVSFDLNGKRGTAPAGIETIGGVAYNLPTPSVTGETFVGWYYSEYNDGSKLTAKYNEQVLTADTTLFAVWASDGVVVSYDNGLISWTSGGVGLKYTLTVYNMTTNQTVMSRANITTTSQTYQFKNAGEYKITITTNNGMTSEAYHKFNVLEAPTLRIVDNSLVYDAVENAERYYVTVSCGTAEHEHTNVDNGTSLYYDFSACDMTASGIVFTVTAAANNYVSASATTTLIRNLDQVTGLTVSSDAVASWNTVDNATAYVLSLTYNGVTTTFNVGTATSYDLKAYAAGDIKIEVYATAHGYNNSTAAAYNYAKTSLSAPTDLAFEGEKITWGAVEGAVSYNVEIDGVVHNVKGTSLTLDGSVIVGGKTEYVIRVQAVAASAANNSVYSDAKTLSYSFDTAAYENGKLVWNAYAGAAYYNVYLNGEKAGETTDTSYAFTYTQAGENTVGVTYVANNGVESDMLTASVTVYEVTLVADGGILLNEYGDDVTPDKMYLATGDAVAMPDGLTKRGYTFGGWYNVRNGAANYGIQYTDTTYQDAEGRTLYAYWMAQTFNVILHYSDGATLTQEVKYHDDYTISVPMNLNVLQAFAGWYTMQNATGSRYTDEYGNSLGTWNDLNDIDLYPGWVNVFVFTPIKDGAEYMVEKSAGIEYISEVTIPSEYLGKPVTTISSAGFKDTANLEVLNIPDTMTDCSEGGSAFAGCDNLRAVNVYHVATNRDIVYGSVDGVLFYNNQNNGVEMVLCPISKTGEFTIPSHVSFDGGATEVPVTTLPVKAFNNTLLSKIVVPYTVTSLNSDCFSNAKNLYEIEFEPTPEGETPTTLEISEGAFKSLTLLTSLTLPSRIETFPFKAIDGCTALAEINVAGEGGNYSSVDGVLTNASKTEVVFVPVAYAGQKGDGVYTTSESITKIGDKAFSINTGVTDVVISAKVTRIGVEAFAKRSTSDALTSNATILSLTFLGDADSPKLEICDRAFYYCSKLTILTIPANCNKIGVNAFGYTSTLTTVYLNSVGEVNFADRAFGSYVTSSTSVPTYYVTTLYISKDTGEFSITGVFGPSKLTDIQIEEGNPYFTAIDNIVYDAAVTKLLYVPVEIDGEYVSPETLVEIGSGAFNGRSKLTKITIGYKVQIIGSDAFNACTSLEEVIFEPTPEGTDPVDLEIGNMAFRDCTQIVSIEFPERTTKIGYSMFYMCYALESIKLPSTLTEIAYGYDQFTVNNEQIVIERIDMLYAVSKTSSYSKISSLTVAEGNTKYAAIDNVLYELDNNGDPSKLLTVPCGYTGDENGRLYVPATVKSVEPRAFYYSQVEEIIFTAKTAPDGFEIKPYAFYYTYASKIELPEAGVTELGPRSFYYAFYNTSNSVTFTVPYTVKSIGYNAFYYCSKLENLNFAETPEGVNPVELRIEDAKLPGTTGDASTSYANFYGCSKLISIELPERTTYIGEYSFYLQYLEDVVIPSTVQEIAANGFRYSTTSTRLYNVTFKTRTVPTRGETKEVSDLTKIGDYAFYYGGMTKLELPASLKSIGSYAFAYCKSITTLTLPENLEDVGDHAFYYSSSIKTVNLPASIKNIDTYAFAYTTALKTINFATDDEGYSGLETIGTYAFSSSGLTEFSFPETKQPIVIGTKSGDTSTKKIFNSCKALTKVRFSSNLADIDDLFTGCTSIREFEVDERNPNFKELPGYPLLLDGSGKVVKLCTNASGRLELPEGITEIGNYAFYGLDGLVSLYLPASMTKIGDNAFQNCTALAEVVAKANPDGSCNLSAIGGYAFHSCSALTTVTIPATAMIEEVAPYTFYNCKKLEDYKLPAYVTKIGNYAFYYCSALTSMKSLPAGITEIGSYAFYYGMLEKVTLSAGTTVGTYAFYHCDNLVSLTIEEGFKEIPDRAFYYCGNLKTVEFPSSIEKIGDYAFYYCSLLKNVTFAEDSHLNFIGTLAFGYTTALEELTLPGSLDYTNIVDPTSYSTAGKGSGMFYHSGIKRLTIEEGVVKLPAYFLYYAQDLETVNIPSTVTTIGAYAFGYTAAQSITIPATVTSIGNYAFTYSEVYEVIFEEPAEGEQAAGLNVGTYLFNYTSNLKHVTLPERIVLDKVGNTTGTTSITAGTYNGFRMFNYSSVETVTLPANLVTIPSGMFAYATALKSISIPASVKEIGSFAFFHAEALEEVDFEKDDAGKASLTTMGNDVFGYTGNIAKVEFPASYAVTALTTATYTFYYSNVKEVVIPAGWTAIPNYFMYYSTAETLNFVDSTKMTNMGCYAFAYATGLKAFEFPANVKFTAAASTTGPGAYLFAYTNLEEFTIPSTWTAIPQYMFAGTKIKTINVPKAVTTIGANAFLSCSELETVTFEARTAALTINAAVFKNTGLKSIDLPSQVKYTTAGTSATAVGGDLFYGTQIEEFTIPSTWTAIPYEMFRNSALKSIVIPKTITAIGSYAFAGCAALENVEFEARTTAITLNGSLFAGDSKITSLELPSSVKFTTPGTAATAAGAALFEGTGITEFTVPSTWTCIPFRMFYNSALKSITFHDKVTQLGNYAFYGTKLTDVTLPSSLTTLGTYCFYNSTLSSINLADTKVTAIPNYCFYGTRLNEMVIPNTISSVGTYSFAYSQINTITLPSNLTAIPNNMFYYSKIKTIDIPEGVEKIGSSAFMYSGLQSVTLPSTLISMDYDAFYGSQLKYIYIPANVQDIKYYSFYNCKELEEVEFAPREDSDTLTMGYAVFYGTTNLKKCNIPGNFAVTNVGTSTTSHPGCNMFYQSGIEEFEIPSTWTAIPYGMFNGAGLKSVYIPKNVKALGIYAFANCVELEEVTFQEGHSGVEIKGSVFNGDVKLTSLEIPEGSGKNITAAGTTVTADGAGLYKDTAIEELVVPSSIHYISYAMFSGMSKLKKITFKGDVEATYTTYYPGYSTATSAVYAAFYGCESLEEVVFEGNATLSNYLFRGLETNQPWSVDFKGIASLGSGVFALCPQLTTVTFEDTVEDLGSSTTFALSMDGVSITAAHVFTGCTSLENLTFAKDLFAIGSGAFCYCPLLTNLHFGEVNSVGNYAFAYCTGLESITFDDIISIGNYAFEYTTSLKSFTFPDTYMLMSTAEGAGMFEGSAVESMTFGENMTAVPNRMFANCSDFSEITFKGTLEAIGDTSFYNTKLGEFTIPDTVKSIGGQAFLDSGLTEVYIPASVESIGNGAFGWCYVDKFEVAPENKKYAADADGNLYDKTNNHIIMMVPSMTGTYTVKKDFVYERQSFHGSKIEKLIIEEGYTDIDTYLFFDMPELTEVTLPSTLQTIGNYAFRSCHKLASIVIPDSVTTIGNNAFQMTGLKSVTIGKGVTQIGNYAFASSDLETIEIPDNVEVFGTYMFNDCDELTTVTFTGNRTSINATTATTYINMFAECDSLTTVNLPETIDSLPRGFYGYLTVPEFTVKGDLYPYEFYHTQIGTVIIPEGTTTIGEYAFYYSDMEHISLPSTLEVIEKYAFYYSQNLKEITIPASVNTISNYAFYHAGHPYSEDDDFTSKMTLECGKINTATYSFGYCDFYTVEFAEGIKEIEFTAASNSTSNNFYYANTYKVVFPASLEKLDAYYFGYYAKFKEIEFKSETVEGSTEPKYNLTYIGPYTFYYMNQVETMNLPTSLKSVGSHAFYYMQVWTGFDGVITLDYVEDYVFGYCKLMEGEFVLSEQITVIPHDLFYYAQKVNKVTMLGAVTSIENYAFDYAQNIESIVIPKTVRSIGNYAFGYWLEGQTIYFEGSGGGIEYSSSWAQNNYATIVYDYDPNAQA